MIYNQLFNIFIVFLTLKEETKLIVYDMAQI